MDLKSVYDKFVKSIYYNRQNIVRVSLSALATLFLLIVLFFSGDDFSVNSEVETLVTYIEDRRYGIAENYYEDLQKEFSDVKMNRFNKKVSKKLSVVLINTGDKFINGQISKEQYMGLINIINSLNTITVDTTSLIELGKRVDEMYKQENITYEDASSYLQTTSLLKGVNQGLDEYKQHIKTLYESRNIYESATKYQSIKKYYDAILLYEKVIKEDGKYYTLAQNAKEDCIKVMYDYYIGQAKSSANEGKYEEALKYLSYLNHYYDDEEINKLQDEYNKHISDYTMMSDDIISLIARRSGESKKNLSVVSYLQTLNGKRYYYAEVTKYDEVINEVLIDTETKKLYSYKSDKKDYNCNFSDAYFKIDENSGNIVFSIDSEQGQAKLEKIFTSEEKKYNSIELLDNDEIKKYSNKELDKMVKENGNIYYYYLVKTGWFKPKEVYIVDIYSKNTYKLNEENVEPY